MNSLQSTLSNTPTPEMTFSRIHTKLDMLITQNDKLDGYLSNEGLVSFLSQTLTTLADIVASIVLVNKTNGLSILRGFKRSELRQYVDKHAVTIHGVNQALISKLNESEYNKPKGMSAQFIVVCDWLNDIHARIPVQELTKQLMSTMDEIHNSIKASDTQEEFDDKVKIQHLLKYYNHLETLMTTITKGHSKLFKFEPNVEKTDVCKFSDAYKSVKEVSVVTDELLDLENSLLDLSTAADVPNQMSSKITAIEDHLRRAEFEISKEFLNGMVQIVKSSATVFELLSTAMHTQLTLEHNHILNYGTMSSTINKE